MSDDAPVAWTPPKSDQEFVFKDIASAPSWVDKGWAGYDAGPALRVPRGDIYGDGPWTTDVARPGDTVKFTAAAGSKPAQFTIIPGDPVKVGEGTKKPAQESGVSLEDRVKLGAVGELDESAKAQVAARSPALKSLIEEPTSKKR